MKSSIIKRLTMMALVIAMLLLTVFPAVEVKADTGPKPSVVVKISGLSGEPCYGTLISESSNSGPHGVYESGSWKALEEGHEDYHIWKKFVDYEDIDGYYFLQWFAGCGETGQFAWTYYPPEKFKILLYFPERDTFVVSEVVERYAFDSYFTVKLDKDKIWEVSWVAPVEKSYNYATEVLGLVARVVITLVVECVLAFVMGFRQKHYLKVIVAVNLVTQITLNVLLNLHSFYNGTEDFVLNYILLEIVVFAIEAVVYCLILNRKLKRAPSDETENDVMQGKKLLTEKKAYIALYALIANVVSLGAGILVAGILPGIF